MICNLIGNIRYKTCNLIEADVCFHTIFLNGCSLQMAMASTHHGWPFSHNAPRRGKAYFTRDGVFNVQTVTSWQEIMFMLSSMNPNTLLGCNRWGNYRGPHICCLTDWLFKDVLTLSEIFYRGSLKLLPQLWGRSCSLSTTELRLSVRRMSGSAECVMLMRIGRREPTIRTPQSPDLTPITSSIETYKEACLCSPSQDYERLVTRI